jgi:hypothetical protein
MKKLGKILLIGAGVLCVVLIVAINFTIGWRPFVGPKKRAANNRQFERTPERVARGRYLMQGVRSLTPVRNSLPSARINFPVNHLVRSAAEPVLEPVQGPDPSNVLARGKYMVDLGCGCHSVADNLNFAGGEHLAGSWGDVVSVNITPDAPRQRQNLTMLRLVTSV